MFLVVEEGVWRDVEEVNVGDVVRGFSEWAFVWGDVDPRNLNRVFGFIFRTVVDKTIDNVARAQSRKCHFVGVCKRSCWRREREGERERERELY